MQAADPRLPDSTGLDSNIRWDELAAMPLRSRSSLNLRVARFQKIFDDDNVAVVVDEEEVIGIIGKIDLVEFLASKT